MARRSAGGTRRSLARVGARRSLCRRPAIARSLCWGPALSVSGPGTLCVGSRWRGPTQNLTPDSESAGRAPGPTQRVPGRDTEPATETTEWPDTESAGDRCLCRARARRCRGPALSVWGLCCEAGRSLCGSGTLCVEASTLRHDWDLAAWSIDTVCHPPPPKLRELLEVIEIIRKIVEHYCIALLHCIIALRSYTALLQLLHCIIAMHSCIEFLHCVIEWQYCVALLHCMIASHGWIAFLRCILALRDSIALLHCIIALHYCIALLQCIMALHSCIALLHCMISLRFSTSFGVTTLRVHCKGRYFFASPTPRRSKWCRNF